MTARILQPCALLLTSLGAAAQGTVNFANQVPGLIDARVLMVSDGQIVGADSRVVAQLYAQGAAGVWSAVGDPVPFRDSPATETGYWDPVLRTLPGIAAGEPTVVRVVAWASWLGSTYEEVQAKGGLGFDGGMGESVSLTLNAGGGSLPPANLVGLQGFFIGVPEPSATTLIALGGLMIAAAARHPKRFRASTSDPSARSD